MSVAGIDIGNQSILIGQAGKGGVDVILNESSNRQTATCISIQGKQRFIGDAAAAMARSNVYNTITNMKLLLGRKFDDSDVTKELTRVPFKAARLPHGGVGILINYNDETITVPVEHLFAMILIKAKGIAAYANNGVNVGDAVLAVPFWFTDAQRRGVLQAAEIAGLNCLKVANESTLIGLSYGIFKSAKKLFSETEPVHIMFVDIGFSGYCVTIVDYIQENMKVRATVCERGIGGRDFDDIIVEYMAECFQKKTGINVRKNIKAVLKLEAAAEKAKKTLSPAGVSEANISVECLAEDHDLNCVLSRDEFESRSAHLVGRLEAPILQCLQEAGLDKKDISECELVGGSTRIAIIKKTIGEVLGVDPTAMNYGLKTTMNSDEAVARGGALQCAMLSSRMKVKPFNILDQLPYGITVYFENSLGEIAHVSLYSRGDELPHKPRRLTFPKKNCDFVIKAVYEDVSAELNLPLGEDRIIANYTIKVPGTLTSNGALDVRVTFNIDKHGCLFIGSAQLLEEVPAVVVVPAEEKDAGNSKDEDKDSGKSEGKESETIAVENNKKKFKKIDLEIITSNRALSREQIKACIELEATMANEDRLIVETADKRNELESYIYGMRAKIEGGSSLLAKYAADAEKTNMITMLTNAEDWLYNEGFETSKQEYTRKIADLKALGDKFEAREREQTHRAGAIDGLKKQLDMCKSFCSNRDESHEHVTEEERMKIREECGHIESWLYDILGKQNDLAIYVDPILTLDVISKKRNALFASTNPILTKQKPKPPPAPTKSEEKVPQSSESESASDSKGHAEKDSDKGVDDKDRSAKDDSQSHEANETSSASPDEGKSSDDKMEVDN